ncbi:MAG: hypothetical protein IPI10_04710 [Bacteroidetes bacterium]|nr:hypothetical protein [Bacteroidota bacterium]MBK8585625.1 hypothetical protein [Bacteroidota bacterium]
MKKSTFIIFILFLLLSSKQSYSQWTYINAIETSLDQNFINYESWLKNNGYQLTTKYDNIADRKASTMGAIYSIALNAKVYDSKAQPTKIHCYLDSKKLLKSIDVFLINPKPGEFENIQLVLLKSGFLLISESKNDADKTTRTYFQKKKIRLNLSVPEDRSYLTISASTLNNYE